VVANPSPTYKFTPGNPNPDKKVPNRKEMASLIMLMSSIIWNEPNVMKD
jgi:hypothetical protein